MSDEERRELHRWISKAIESKPHAMKDERNSYRSPAGAWLLRLTGSDLNIDYFPQQWTTDETASAMLLEMLPCPKLELLPEGIRWWKCWPWKGGAYIGEDKDRKTAIALAFKAYKEAR